MKTWKKILLWIPAVFALIYILLFLFEIREASMYPDQYHFGGEAMIGNGGDHYRSQEAYITQMKKNALGSTVVFIIFVSGAFYLVRKKIDQSKL